MVSSIFKKLFPCMFNEPKCRNNQFGCRCGKGKGTAGRTALQIGSFIPGPQQPFVMGANAGLSGYNALRGGGDGGGFGSTGIFGPEKSTQEQFQNFLETQLPQFAPGEEELQNLQMGQLGQVYPGITGVQQTGIDLIRNLLSGGNLPGFYGQLAQGISPEVTSNIVSQSLQDITPQFQQGNLLDSGVRANISARVAGDIRNKAEQFNIQNRLNLLQAGLTGQAQVQQPILAREALLSSRFAGLRPIATSKTGAGGVTTRGINPFMQSFQTAFGGALGPRAPGAIGDLFNVFKETLSRRKYPNRTSRTRSYYPVFNV